MDHQAEGSEILSEKSESAADKKRDENCRYNVRKRIKHMLNFMHIG